MNVITAIEYLFLGAGVLGVLFVIGFPLTYLARRLLDPRWFVPAPVAGLALIQVCTWYWFVLGGDGVAAPAVTLTVVGAALTVGIVVVGRRRAISLDPETDWRLAGGAAVATVFVCAANYWYLLTLPGPTSASVGNNDIAAYAVTSGHLRVLGFDDYGAIIGDNIGNTARTNAFGSSTVISALGSVLRQPSGRIMMVVIFVLVGVLLYGLTRLILELRPDDKLVALLAATGACASVLFIYIVSQYFLGQIMAMAMIPFILIGCLRAVPQQSVRSRVALSLGLTIPFLVMLSHYLHMAFLAPVVVVPPAVLAAWSGGFKELVRSFVRVGTTAVAGLFLGALLVPQWITEGVAQIRNYASATAGWPLADYWPAEVMGFMRGVTPVITSGRWILSAVVVLVFLGAVGVLWRSDRRLAVWGLCLALLVAGSYLAAIYQYGSGSYRQWKWITFFQPVIAASVLAMIGAGVGQVIRRLSTERIAQVSAVGVTAVLVLCIWVNPGSDPRPPGVPSAVAMRSRPAAVVDEADYELDDFAAVRRADKLNVDLGAYWRSMWAVAMLSDRTLALLAPSYFAVSPPVAPASISASSPSIEVPGAVSLSKHFVLAPAFAGPTSTDPAALGATLERTGPSPSRAARSIKIEATNTGTSSWITAPGVAGVVGVGGRLVDADGVVVDQDWFRQPLVDPWVVSPLPPGTKVSTTVKLPEAPAPGMTVELQLVSEQISWFGSTVRAPLSPSN